MQQLPIIMLYSVRAQRFASLTPSPCEGLWRRRRERLPDQPMEKIAFTQPKDTHLVVGVVIAHVLDQIVHGMEQIREITETITPCCVA